MEQLNELIKTLRAKVKEHNSVLVNNETMTRYTAEYNFVNNRQI